MKKYSLLLFPVIVIIFGLSIFFGFTGKEQSKSTPQDHGQVPQVISASNIASASANVPDNLTSYKVSRVIDGDTIELENGQRVRYIGIDTPETVDPRKPVQCFGQESLAKNKQLVEGKTVRLEKDVSETDKYGRLLRYVYLPSEASAKEGVDNIFVNDYLVEEGFAHASSYPPDIKYQNQFTDSQKQAQLGSKGLWSSCQGQTNQPSTVSQSGCLVKGNISSSGEKIYHLPGQKYYDKTTIDTAKGERWFCSEEEAQQAGWRKSKI